jgi:hypothetical protein
MKRSTQSVITIGLAALYLFPSPTISANGESTSKQIILIAPVMAHQAQRPSSRYERPTAPDGLYGVTDTKSAFYPSSLVLSYNGKPIPAPEHDPNSPTKPGFYLPDGKHIAFQRIEVIDKKVYFKTRSVGGVSYEFVGNSGAERDPVFDSVAFIEGEITTLKNGKPVGKEKIRFNQAVIA